MASQDKNSLIVVLFPTIENCRELLRDERFLKKDIQFSIGRSFSLSGFICRKMVFFHSEAQLFVVVFWFHVMVHDIDLFIIYLKSCEEYLDTLLIIYYNDFDLKSKKYLTFYILYVSYMKYIKKYIFIVFSIYLSVSSTFAVDISSLEKTISTVDSYYEIFLNHVSWKTKNIWLQSLRKRLEDKVWSALAFAIDKKIPSLQWDQKIVFQSLRSKIINRNNTISLPTINVVNNRDLINKINDYRKTNNLPQFSYNQMLSQAAYNHAYDMYTNFPYDTDGNGSKELISHVGSDGSRVWNRVEKLWYNSNFVAENIAYNQTSSQEVLNDWIASPTHYENLITKKATEIWVAKVWSYWVLVLGKWS